MQALTPRERCCRFLIVRPSGPLSRLGKGGGGKGQIRLWLPWERFSAQYGLISAAAVNQSVSSTASDRGLGAAPQACFADFCTNKSQPPPGRRANQAIYKTYPTGGDYKLFHERPADRRLQTSPRRAGVPIRTCKRLAPPSGACKLFHEHPPQATTKQHRRWATANQPPKKKQPAHRRLLRFVLWFYSIPVSCLVMRSQPM